MKPGEFENLQPGEFYKWLEAWKVKKKDEDYRRAYFLSWMLLPYGKVDYRKIAGLLWKDDKVEERDIKELMEERRKLKQEFGIKEVEGNG